MAVQAYPELDAQQVKEGLSIFSGKNVILLGPPGAGKTTLMDEVIKMTPSANYISLGEISRSVDPTSQLGARITMLHATRQPWPADLVVDMVMPHVLNCPRGFVLDGVPRKTDEALALLEALSYNGIPVDLILHLDATEGICLSRVQERLIAQDSSNARPEKMDHYLARYRLQQESMDGVLGTLQGAGPNYHFIDTTNLSPEDVLMDLASFSLQELK